MPTLTHTGVVGRIVWLGVVPSRDISLASSPRDGIRLRFDGPEGEDHGGATRPSCSRVLGLYPRGTEIRNVRQITIMATEELAEIAAAIGVDRFDPAWAGATIVVEGIADFTHLPPSTRLQIEGGPTVTIDLLNTPCNLPGPVIEEAAPGSGRKFKSAAKGRRGVTAWVEREGLIHLGAAVHVHIPTQRPWRGLPSTG